MKNPLIKRVPKELIGDWQKYLVIVVFMVLMIGFVSGMSVGRDSMLKAINDGKVTLKLEDGSFEFKKKASEDLIAAIEKGDMADVREYLIAKALSNASKDETLSFRDIAELQKILGESVQNVNVTGDPKVVEMTQGAIDALSKWSGK